MDTYDWYEISQYIPKIDPEFLNVYIVDEITSTSDWVKDAVTKGICPAVCIAESQTSGRGRNGRLWASASGESITMSVGLSINTAALSLSGLSLVIGIVVARILTNYGIDAVVKWPNDVLVSGRKIAGILIETKHKISAPLIVIIGIGINFRLTKARHELVDQAITDVFSECSSDIPCRNEIVGMLLHQLIAACSMYEISGLTPFLDEWNKYDVCYGKKIKIIENGSVYDALAMGIATDGALRIIIDNKERLVYAADVSVRVE